MDHVTRLILTDINSMIVEVSGKDASAGRHHFFGDAEELKVWFGWMKQLAPVASVMIAGGEKRAGAV